MQGTSIGPNVLFGTRDVACIIYRARGERVYVHLSSIESSIDGLRITGPNVDTLLADYRAAWKQFSTATLPLSLPFYPFPFCPPAFSRLPAMPAFQFFSLFLFFFFFFFFWSFVSSLFLCLLLSLCRLSSLCTRRHQSAGPIGECFHPDESSRPEARKEIGADFVFFWSGRPPVGRFVSHDFRNIGRASAKFVSP